ncbi:MAG: hypothetical protein OEZ20_06410 [candidate division WOR-3 bacterium]|nr:hypothetical protein [candidate division WOR-3 bacterium]
MRILLIIPIVFLTMAFADAPRFNGPNYINDGGVQIDVGYYAAPYIYDWDGDLRKDMIVGQFSYGYIRFYPNVGSDENPEFNGYQFLYASGSMITVPSG